MLFRKYFLVGSVAYALLSISMYLSISSISFAKTICTEKTILGRVETVKLPLQKIELKAKLDSGAGMSSLSAKNITLFKINNQTWVRFILPSHLKNDIVVFTRLFKTVAILQRKDEVHKQKYSIRPVVKIAICLGKTKKNILVNLIDRQDFHYSLLLGVDALKALQIIIDPSQFFLAGSPSCQ